MSSPGHAPANVFTYPFTDQASHRTSRALLNTYLTPDWPILKTSSTSSSKSCDSTVSTADSTFSIRSSGRDLSPSTPPDDLEESSNQIRKIRFRNLSISPTRAPPRKPRVTSQVIAFQPKADEYQNQIESQNNYDLDDLDDQDEVELKIPGAFNAFPEQFFVHRNRKLEVDNTVNSKPVQYPILPVVEPQHPKFASYGSAHKSAREINHSIRSLLQKPLKPQSDLSPGYIYAFESPSCAPSHIKIGRSSRAPETRMREWSKCGMPITKVPKSTSHMVSESSDSSGKDAFYHYTLVESILFEEFHNQRKWFECGICRNSQRGPRRHVEWLEIDALTATHAIDRWRTWLERQKPFTSSGKLTAFWQWKVDELPKRSSNMNWDNWTQSEALEHCDFWLEQFSFYTSKLKPHIMRKDKQFWTTGCLFVVVSSLLYGPECTLFFTIVLLAL
ncbi:hypothetical protein SBOR_3574 [Sclerotinia borealis F-4128]|uniref:Bacteriophage T5 Orf172 DNA-binding domain-containing protein n=1 Tax=Sclerotinia borealis (strain F-4128) TaxID=1432307 RepID=W9CH73_SCLBF|nr:hypothetical protein SBOR_3574 [Sclerotinia borealis F-4128]